MSEREPGPIRKWLKEWEPLVPRPRLLETTAIYPPVDNEIEMKREAKRLEWEKKGYPEKLIEKAFLLADRWISSLADSFGTNKEVREAIIRGSYDKALSVAENWIVAMMK